MCENSIADEISSVRVAPAKPQAVLSESLSWSHLSILARFSEAAYDHGVPLWSANALPYGWTLPSAAEMGLSLSYFDGHGFFRNDQGIEAFVAYNQFDNSLVIAIRGTQGFEDLVTDAHIWARVTAELAALQPLLGGVYALAEDRGASLHITGHSLGGVIAEAIAGRDTAHFSGGAFFGSPGSFGLAGNLELNHFVHVTRQQDPIGTLAGPQHAAHTLNIDDYEFFGPPLTGIFYPFPQHLMSLYVAQTGRIAASALAPFLPVSTSNIAFGENDGPTTVDLNGVNPGHGFDPIFFGGRYDDTISYSGSGSAVRIDGGLGYDTISGGPLADILAGGSGDDGLAGEGGNDRLIGGTDNDRYSIGVYEGADTVADRGNGLDILAVSTGSAFSTIDLSWLIRDGNDLLIRAYATDGSLALDVRIEDMGSTYGRIESLDLLAGDGFTVTDQLDLAAHWADLSQPPGPPAPPPVTPPPQSGVFTSGNDSIVRGNSNDVLTTRGQGQDSVDFGDGLDTLIVDYSWVTTTVITQWSGTTFHYLAGDPLGAIGNASAYNLERVVLIGGPVYDDLWGGTGDDILSGELGNDALISGFGDDTLLGGGGDDIIWDGVGVDWIDGGAGFDHWNGYMAGETRDVQFLFDRAASATGFTLVNGTHIRNVERVSLTTGSGDDSFWFTGSAIVTAASDWNAGLGDDHLIVDLSGATGRIDLFLSFSGFMVLMGGQASFSATDIERLTGRGGSANDSMVGLSGDDVLTGNGGNDYLRGESGDDRLEGGAGNDDLIGGEGNDWFDGGSGDDFAEVNLGAETQVISFSAISAASAAGLTLVEGTYLRNVERVSLTTGSGDDAARFATLSDNSWAAGAGTDRLTADFSNQTANIGTFFWNSGAYAHGFRGGGVLGQWNAWNSITGISFDSVEALTVTTGSGDDTLHGGDRDDIFTGNGGSDYLYGNAGNDHLEGGASNDSLDGGSDDDTLIGGDGDDHLTAGLGKDWIDGGNGDDIVFIDLSNESRMVAYSGIAAASGSGLTLVNGTHIHNIERVNLTTGSGDDTARFSTLSDNSWNAGNGADRLIADFSSETTNIGTFFWNSGAYAHGFRGGGVLGQWNAWNSITGIRFDSVEALTVVTGSGDDTLHGGGGEDEFTGNGGSDYLYGDAGNDRLEGGAGDDRLDGGAGADRLDGRAGNDLFFIDTASDVVIEAAGGGSDCIVTDVSYTLGAGAEVERIEAAGAALSLTGNGFAQTLIGNDGNNILNGAAGADVLDGGAGDDFYYLDSSADRVVEGSGRGNDRVFASVSYALGVGISVETITTTNNAGTNAINLSGNELANLITGNDGVNTLNGGAGADTLVGRLGDDFYFVDNAGDRVVESAGQGNDRVFAGVSYTLGAGVSAETVSTMLNTGIDAINLTGNELANTLYGNDGINILNGGAGADILAGRLGDDFYYVDNAADRVIETGGQGNDRVFTGVSYALGAGVSVETFTTSSNTGTTAINLTGNEFANTIHGNDGANILDGKGGVDTLVGRLGDDFYYVDNTADRILESVGQGTDRLFAAADYTLAAGVSVETLSTIANGATTAINLAGNELAQTIYGNAGTNILDGKAGADTLVGMAGADSFAFTTVLGATNVDRIVDFSSVDDAIRLDDAVFAGIGPLGLLNANAFVVGTRAGDANDRIVYNQATGQLFFDADGNGAGAAVLFATLQGAPVVGAADFVVV